MDSINCHHYLDSFLWWMDAPRFFLTVNIRDWWFCSFTLRFCLPRKEVWQWKKVSWYTCTGTILFTKKRGVTMKESTLIYMYMNDTLRYMGQKQQTFRNSSGQDQIIVASYCEPCHSNEICNVVVPMINQSFQREEKLFIRWKFKSCNFCFCAIFRSWHSCNNFLSRCCFII